MNRLTGPIPEGSLTALTALNVGSNMLNGSVPDWICDNTGLQTLCVHPSPASTSLTSHLGPPRSLGSNQMSGSIPVTVGLLTGLRSLCVCRHQPLFTSFDLTCPLSQRPVVKFVHWQRAVDA